MPDWPHSPPHRLFEPGTYIVTGATYRKAHFFNTPGKLTYFHDLLLSALHDLGWSVQAWAVMSNHYHFIAHSIGSAAELGGAIKNVHSQSARSLNKADDMPGRRVWYQFWDTHITYEKSYFPRLSYVHGNAVHHGLVGRAQDYDWCSACWLESRAAPAYRKLLASFKTNRLNIYDDF